VIVYVSARLKHTQSHVDQPRTEHPVHVFDFHRYLLSCAGDLGRAWSVYDRASAWCDVVRWSAKHKNVQVQRICYLQESEKSELLPLLWNSWGLSL